MDNNLVYTLYNKSIYCHIRNNKTEKKKLNINLDGCRKYEV